MNLLKTISGLVLMGLLWLPNAGFGQTKQGKKVNWIECIGTDVTEFGGYCFAPGKNNARAYITNNCTEKVTVWIEFTGSCYNKDRNCNKTKKIYISGNSKSRDAFCNVKENSGSIRVTKVEPTEQYGNSSTNQSNNSQNDDDKWTKGESLTKSSNTSSKSSSYTNNSSSSYQEESIYQKRQREARERKQREREYYQKQQDQVDEVIKQGETRVNNIKSAKQTWDNAMKSWGDNLSREIEEEHRQVREMQLRQKREIDRQNRLNAEKARKDRIERERREREEAEKRRISESQYNFMKNIEDQKIPIFYNKNKAYVIFVSKTNSEKIQLIPTLLHKNSDNQLPYKQDVINALEKDRNLKNLYVYGVYDNFDEFKNIAVKLSTQAQNSYILISETARFEYGKPQKNITAENKRNENFWGEKKKNTKTKKTDFWNN